MNVFEELSQSYNLKLNKKKCGIFQIGKNNIKGESTLRGIDILKEYKYLGILINNKGNIKNQLNLL